MNLQKVVQDLHGADEQTKVVALTLLLKLPGDQLVSDAGLFRQLCGLTDAGARQGAGRLGELFLRFQERLDALRREHEARLRGEGPPDLAALGRGDAAGQIRALESIRKKKYAAGIGEVRALLEVGGVDRVTAAAIAVLGVLGSREPDFAKVRSFLGHPAGRIRAEAVQAFAKLATPDEIAHTLGPALGDRHPQVRSRAIRALGRVGKEALLDRLRTLAGAAAPEERARALPLLLYLRGEEILEIVRRLAADPSDSIRMDVVNILRSHGGKNVGNTLEWLAQDNHQAVRQHAARSLVLIKAGRGQRPGLSLAQLDSIPDDPGDFEVPSFDDLTPPQRVQALMRIKRQGPVGAYDRVAALLDREDLRLEVVASALSAIAVLGGREDVARVRPFLAHMDGRVRANAVEAVDVMGGRKEILTWLTPLLADPIPRVKKNVLTALGRFGEAVFLGHLQRMVLSSHVPVRISGVYALAHYPGAAAKKLAMQVLKDKQSEVRVNFAEALAGRTEAWTREVLEEMASSDMDFKVRDAAKTSLTAGAKADPAASARVAGLEVGKGPAAPGGAPPAGATTPRGSAAKPGAGSPGGPGSGAAAAPPATPASAPVPRAPAAPAAPGGEAPPVYTMVDGLPMCPIPDEPAPSIRVAKAVQARDGLGGGRGASGDGEFHPSVAVPRELVLGAAKEAAADAAAEAAGDAGDALDDPPPAVAEGEALVLESMTANAQDDAMQESSTDALGRTFMNFAALISPGKMSTMKEVQKLDKDRSELLERMGREVFRRIEGGLKNPAFDRTLYVLRKYQHSLKQGAGAAGDAPKGGWFGKLFSGEPGPASGEPPQLRAQYRNLAKDALALLKAGELEAASFLEFTRPIAAIDEKIQAVQAGSE